MHVECPHCKKTVNLDDDHEFDDHTDIQAIKNQKAGEVSALKTLKAKLKTLSGEMFSNGKDDLAKMYREMAKELDADIQKAERELDNARNKCIDFDIENHRRHSQERQ